MNKVVFSILTVGLLMTALCSGASVMTMTTSQDNVKVRLAGSGNFTIDWGDGSEPTVGALKQYNQRWWHKREIRRDYADESLRTITITGENITHLACYGNGLTTLDVSNNAALTFLECWFNQLTHLDVSKNAALTFLDCTSNQLTNLDVSKNTELTRLVCGYNLLKSLDVSNNNALVRLSLNGNVSLRELDVSNNTALTGLSCVLIPLREDALNNMFRTLNSNPGKKIVMIGCTSGQLSYDMSIAANKGWNIDLINVTPRGRKNSFFIPDI